VHEIKLDAYRMAARIDNGRVQLLTRTGLDWTAKYPRSSDRVEPSRLATGPLVGFTRRVS
jgi:bifunctional non-homologous end joining protein LigD